MENKLIYSKMIAIMQGVGFVGKDKKNQHQGYMFRGIDEMYNELHPLFSKHGVFISSEVLEQNREERTTKSGGLLIYTILKICFTFHAQDGSFITTTVIGEAMDSGDKSCNKAMSTALKYALMQALLIPTKEAKDTENDNPEPIKKPLPKPIKVNMPLPGKKSISDAAFVKAIKRIEAGEKDLILKLETAYKFSPVQQNEFNNVK